MYESPIEIIVNKITEELRKTETDYYLRAVKDVGINVNEAELLKALEYDRHQYEKGYKDALVDMQRITDLVKDVNPAEIAHHIEMGNLADWCKVIQIECERVLNGGNNN